MGLLVFRLRFFKIQILSKGILDILGNVCVPNFRDLCYVFSPDVGTGAM